MSNKTMTVYEVVTAEQRVHEAEIQIHEVLNRAKLSLPHKIILLEMMVFELKSKAL